MIDVVAVPDGATAANTGVFNSLFGATVEAVEEAVVNALFAAETTQGRDGHTLHALPIDRTLDILRRSGHL